MRVIICDNNGVRYMSIASNVASLQRVVGGNVAFKQYRKGVVFYNERMAMDGNCNGTIIIAGWSGDYFCDIDRDECEIITRTLAEEYKRLGRYDCKRIFKQTNNIAKTDKQIKSTTF